MDNRRIIPTIERDGEIHPAPPVIVEFFDYAGPIFAVVKRLEEKARNGQDVAREVETQLDRLNSVYYEFAKGLRAKDGERLNVTPISPPIGLG